MRHFVLMCLLSLPATAIADPFADFEGNWSGSGSAREAVESPQEAIRCRMTNTYSEQRAELSLKGDCVASGKKIALTGMIRKDATSEAVSGFWYNPNGVGDVRISGSYGEDFIVFAYRTEDPTSDRVLSQNVEMRLVDGALQMRSVDREDPSVTMTDIVLVK